MRSLPDIVDEWLTERQSTAKRRISEGSANSYRSDLVIWAKTIAEILSIPTIDKGDEELALESMRRRSEAEAHRLRELRQNRELGRIDVGHLTEVNARAALATMSRTAAPATQERRLAALSGFCRWLQKRRYLEDDPTQELGTPKTTGRLPVGFSDAEVKRIFEAAAASRRGASSWPVRDAAIVRTLAGTGIRNAELTGLRVGSFDRDMDPCLLRVHGKGGKTRLIPVPTSTLAHIDCYLQERKALGLGGVSPTDILFVRKNGTAMDRFAVDRLLDRIFVNAGVSLIPGEKAHRFRHAYAKRMLAMGMTINQVQALLGHESLQTTGVYTRLGATDVLDAARLAHGAED